MPSSQTDTALNFETFGNVVDGKLCDTQRTRCTINPSTLEENPPVPLSTRDDLDHAVEAARHAAASWAKVSWEDRKEAILGFAAALENQLDEFAKMLTKEQGKTFPRAQLELKTGVQWLRDFCELSLRENILEENGKRRITTRYTPLGVVAAMASPFTPYCNLKLAELGLRFFPAGVLQALSGDDNLGPWMTEHAGIDKIAFTGSALTGKKVMESCSRTLKRVTLELGGNDPAIICADADMSAIPTILGIAFDNAGQICCTIKRLYDNDTLYLEERLLTWDAFDLQVHEDIYDAVLATALAVLQHFKPGDGFEDGVFIPPLTNVQHLLADVRSTKLKLACGSTEPLQGAGQSNGYFFAPTIVDNPPENSQIVTVEQFGPVLPFLKWKDEDEVVDKANNTQYGLGASVWTRDMERAERISTKLQAGTVWINSHAEIGAKFPFGGHKESGIGVEWGVEGLKAYCNLQTVVTRSAPWDGQS
ncbi:Aldehyde/histidinol dehydrogenase [Xylariaceae sp. FL0255]|nr:Aldehyde/histidinol dehydrogenase [Xylariaceae sp. FL0255]